MILLKNLNIIIKIKLRTKVMLHKVQINKEFMAEYNIFLNIRNCRIKIVIKCY